MSQQTVYGQQGSYGPPAGGPPQEHFAGQQEVYEPSPLGRSVPKVEAGNPKGIIRCADLSLTVEGELVPVVEVALGTQMPIYFEHHILLFKSPEVRIQFSPWAGAFRRFFGGLQIIQTEAHGPGTIAFSRDNVGQIVCLRLAPGRTVEVREHQFLMATANIAYSVTTFQGMGNLLFSRTGLLIDQFTCKPGTGDGLLLLHGFGNVMERYLQPGEALDVEPGAWLWKDPSVRMETISVLSSGGGGGGRGFFNKLATGVANLTSGGGSMFLNRLYGPGTIALQTCSYYPPQSEGAPAAGGTPNW